MKRNPIPEGFPEKDGVIPPPYVLEDGDDITDCYLEPVLFHNENGPTIGVTTCGVIVKDGLYFKDMDNTGELSPYKDWRLDPETRAKDMVKHLRLDQQAGLVLNVLNNTPESATQEEATDENGKIIPGKLFKHHDPDAEPGEGGPLAGISMANDDADVTEKKITAGVYRGEMAVEAGMSALYQNFGTQMLEYEACKGGAAIPYSLHTNPINIGYPDSLGLGAAVMGDGNYDMIYEMADTDRKMMKAAGQNVMYGPQIDVASDPRWPRTNGTFGERTDVTCGITKELIRGYQNGEDGLNEGSVVLTVKHFPGDAPSENGFEPHMPIGQWRLYPTEGSMEKYHLPPFQTAFDMNVSGIMPDYSRIANDGRTKPQYYHGKLTSSESVPSCYSKELITDLARGEMGFDGYVNSDSGVISAQAYGQEDKTVPERYAKVISAGTDVIGGNSDSENIVKAVEDGLLPKEDLDRASYNRLLSMFRTKRVDNPYLDPDEANRVREENLDNAKKAAYKANQKEVVLAKNHGNVLPIESGKKVYIACFAGDEPYMGGISTVGIPSMTGPTTEEMKERITKLFTERGFVVVDSPEEADYAYLHVWPKSNDMLFYQYAMPVIDLVDHGTFEEREPNKSQKKTGNLVTISTLNGLDEIPELCRRVHDHGGKVITTCVVRTPWILTKLEPYTDVLLFQYTVSGVAMDNALNAQLDVMTGVYHPTGKMSLTMVSSPDVVAITEKEIDGEMHEVCASPNDVPGYDKDQYIDPEILAKVPGHSYAYYDEDGNYYRSGFGLTY